jgi:hypothetical protein
LAAQFPVGAGFELVLVLEVEAEVARVVVVGAVVALLVVVDVLAVVVVGLGPETAKADCKMGM